MYNAHVSDKALRDFAYRVMISEIDALKMQHPGVTPAELRFFVEQLEPWQLTQIYGMFFKTGMVQ